MAEYFVRKSGSDSNAGTSPSQAWATIGKALGAAGISSGDTVYIGAGVYRESVTVNMTSAVAETRVVGDVDGAKTGDIGEVRWTGYTDDKILPSAGQNLILNGRDFLTFEKIVFVGGNNRCIDASTTLSTNITINDCYFISGNYANMLIRIDATAQGVLNWTFNRCIFIHAFRDSHITIIPAVGSSSWDLNVRINNCLFLGGATAQVYLNGGATCFAGGVYINNCTFGFNEVRAFRNDSTRTSQTFPCRINNCFFIGSFASAAIEGGHASQTIQDYNYFACGFPNTLTTTNGSNSRGSGDFSYHFHIGQEIWQGKQIKPALTPCLDSPLLSFGNVSGSITDYWNRTRPAGCGPLMSGTGNAVGYIEYHDYGNKENSVVDGIPNPLKLIGPGDQDLYFPVESGRSTNFSILGRYDSLHGTTNKPQVILLSNGELGISGQTGTMTASNDTWESISSFIPFIPSGNGWTSLRLVSRPTGISGIAYFSSINIY